MSQLPLDKHEIVYYPREEKKAASSESVRMVQKSYKKKSIPVAVKRQLWRQHFGEVYKHKCYVSWCTNSIDVFSFEAGHIIPESKGGATSIENMRPICSGCNKSMSNRFTIAEWEDRFTKESRCFPCLCYW